MHAALGALVGVVQGLALVLLLHVCAEAFRLRVGDSAECALERFLREVDHNMSHQGLLRDKLLVAHGAKEQLLSRVEPHVQSELLLPFERLPTIVASKVGFFLQSFFLQRKYFLPIMLYKCVEFSHLFIMIYNVTPHFPREGKLL